MSDEDQVEEEAPEGEEAPSPSKFVEGAPGLISEVAAAADEERDRLAAEAEEGSTGQVAPAIQEPLYAPPPEPGEAEEVEEADAETEDE